MRTIYFILTLLIFPACTRVDQPSDDYVLIEFASKLEEDYQKLVPPQDSEKK